MSELSDAERFTLSRAGFTDREINTMKRKFYNLFRVNPLLTTEVTEFHAWMKGEIPEQIRLDEMEACAKIADTWKNNVSWEGKTAADNIAHQIRARGKA